MVLIKQEYVMQTLSSRQRTAEAMTKTARKPKRIEMEKVKVVQISEVDQRYMTAKHKMMTRYYLKGNNW